MSIEQSSMSGGTRGRSFTGLFAPPKCAASGRVIKTGCQLWMIKIIGRLTRPCSGWPLPFTAHSPRGSAWCSTSRKAETMLGRSFSGKTARGPRRRGACGKGRRSTCPRFLACYSNTNKDCIERYERGEVKRRFSTQPRRVGTLRGDPRPAARCGERDVFRSNDDEYKQARLLSKSHHHYSPRAAKLNNARRAELPRGTASSAMVSPRPTSGGGGFERPGLPHLAHNQRWGNRSPPRGAGHVASYLSTDLKSHRSAASPIHTRPGSQIQTHVGAGTRTLLGPRAPASRRRALRGAAQGGAVVVSRFPLLARS